MASPSNRATNVPTSSTLSWTSSTGATSYGLHVSVDSSFSALAVNQSGITATSFAVSGPANNTTYYWRVGASNARGAGNWSSTRSFTAIPSSPPASTRLSPSNGAIHPR